MLIIIVGSSDQQYEDNDDETAQFVPGTDTNDMEKNAWRMMAPFVLLICAFLLGVYVLIGGRLWPFSGTSEPLCQAGLKPYWIKGGDTCWDIAVKYDMTLDDLLNLNKKLNCDNLKVGSGICVIP
jgi:hypothetical protein